MRKSLWLFLLKLVIVTGVLGYLWYARYQTMYPYWIDPFATWFFKLVGVRKWWLSLTVEHFTNLVPYVGLVLSTPGIIKGWRRSLLALIVGLVVLVIGHVLMSTGIYFVVEKHAISKAAYRYIVPIYLINDALPLVLWLAFYPRLVPEMFRLRCRERGGEGEAGETNVSDQR